MKACKFCGQQIQMVKNAEGKWFPNNPDGSPHRCRSNQPKVIEEHIGKAKPSTPNEHQKFQDQKAILSPAMETAIKTLVRTEVASILRQFQAFIEEEILSEEREKSC